LKKGVDGLVRAALPTLPFWLQSRSENLPGFHVESPQLIDGHLSILLSVIMDVQSPTPLGPEARKSSGQILTLKLIALLARQPGCLINRLFISFP
jgi:hypothetical protein